MYGVTFFDMEGSEHVEKITKQMTCLTFLRLWFGSRNEFRSGTNRFHFFKVGVFIRHY